MSDETGVVKFACEHVATELAPFPGLEELNACRRKLLQFRMIGVDANGIGFGNLSVRAAGGGEFFITASGTGGRPQLSVSDFAKVTTYDLERNWLRCEGHEVASSESLTHAAVYASEMQVGSVIHCHSNAVWTRLLTRGIATSVEVEYGTPEMAFEVQHLFRETNVRQQQIFAMAGHADGVIAFGKDVNDAFAALMRQRAT